MYGPDGTCTNTPGGFTCALCLEPSANCQVTVFLDSDMKGSSSTLGIGDYPTPDTFNPPGTGISSLRVGSSARAAIKTGLPPLFGGGHVAFFNSADGTYVGDDVNDTTVSIKLLPADGGPMATYYRGNFPSASC